MPDETFEFVMLRDFHATKAEFIDRVFKSGGDAVIRQLSLCLCVCICMCVYKSREEEEEEEEEEASLVATWLPSG
ncbi:hypothetical protein LguiA_011743 [Lonicera macranthoides]